MEYDIFRWEGLKRDKGFIKFLCVDKRVVDFGGYSAPLSKYIPATVVDIKGPVFTLAELKWNPNVIFTSHTLEHVDDLDDTLRQFRNRMTDGGVLICHVPSWLHFSWWPHKFVPDEDSGSTHKRIFGLAGDVVTHTDLEGGSLDMIVDIDTAIAKYFEILSAHHVGDDSILVYAQKVDVD